MLRARQGGNKFAAVQGDRKIDVGEQFDEQPEQHFDVFGAVIEYLLMFLGGERPPFHDAVAHRVLVLRCDAAQPEVLQSAN